MTSVKNTNELMHELDGDAPFGQYAEENEGAFLRTYTARDGGPSEKTEEARTSCPFCNVPLQEGASYCFACMRPLQERRIIPVKKRRTGRPARVLWTVLGISAFLAIAAAVILLVVLPAILRQSAPQLPSPVEFRVLAAGASEEETQMMWSREDFTLSAQESGFAIYETRTHLTTEAPLRLAFSEDGKCLFFALQDFPADESDEAMKLVKTAFSAAYRAFPDNLEQLLDDSASFSAKEAPDGALTELLGVFGAAVPEGAEIRESLPIYAGRITKMPCARVYRISSGGRISLFVRFDTEGT